MLADERSLASAEDIRLQDRANYWLAQSLRARGQNARAEEVLEVCAAHAHTFYGQACLSDLGRKLFETDFPRATVKKGLKSAELEELKVRADANASIQPPSGPNVNADGSGGSELRTRLRRDVDLVESTTTYAFEWRVESACPVAVAVSIFGEVQARIPCAPDAGSSALSRRRLLEAGEVNSAPRGTATAVVVAVDCHGHEVRCQVELTEP